MRAGRVAYSEHSTETGETLRDMFEKMRNKIDFGEALDEQKLREKYDAKIQAKLENGKRLSSEEMKYLQRYNPVMYMHALRIEMQRRAVEERLKHARSKTEVQEIQSEAMSSIAKNDPVRKYIVAAVQETITEFKKTDSYKRLPETEEKEKNAARVNKLRNDSEDEIQGGEIKTLTYETGMNGYQMAYTAENASEETGFNVVS